MSRIDCNDLEVFAAVAAEGSIRGAAQRLSLSQPSVSSRLRRLERQLGATLLERSTRGAELTPLGRTVLGAARRVGEALDDVVAAARQRTDVRTLAVCTSATLGPYMVPFVDSALQHQGIDVILTNSVASTTDAVAALEDGSADVVFGPPMPARPRLVSVPFFRDRLAVVARPSHPLMRGHPVSLAAVAPHRVAIVDWGAATEPVVDALLASGIQPQHLRTVTPVSTAMMLAFYNEHLAISARSTVSTAVREGLLVEVPVGDLPGREVEVAMAYRTGDADDLAVGAVRAAVEREWEAGSVPVPSSLAFRSSWDVGRRDVG